MLFGGGNDHGPFSETGGGTTVRRFSVLGAKSVMILYKADSGTPTITVGAYVMPKATRDTTLTNYDLLSKVGGGSVANGNYIAVYPSNAAADFVTNAAEILMPIAELDVSVAGNVTNLEVKICVLY